MKRLFLFMAEVLLASLMVVLFIFTAILPFLMLSGIIHCGSVGNCIMYAICIPVCFMMFFGLDMLRRKYVRGQGMLRTFEWYCKE